MKQQRAVKVELYPTDEQRILIHKTFGCVRAVWNDMLGDEQEFYAAADKHFVPTLPSIRRSAPTSVRWTVWPSATHSWH